MKGLWEDELLLDLKSTRFELMNSPDPAKHQMAIRLVNNAIDRLEYEIAARENQCRKITKWMDEYADG